MTDPFTAVPDRDLARLVSEMPLCWIVPHAAPEAAILMPVVLERLNQEGTGTLLGHLPRRSPAAKKLADTPTASFLVIGPNAYISPAMAGRSDWAPTWNFLSARLTGEVEIDAALTRTSVEAIVAMMEGPGGWRIDHLGARVDDLLAQIIGFRATLRESEPRFKLGQDENAATRDAIAAAIAGTPLGDWLAEYAAR